MHQVQVWPAVFLCSNSHTETSYENPEEHCTTKAVPCFKAH